MQAQMERPRRDGRAGRAVQEIRDEGEAEGDEVARGRPVMGPSTGPSDEAVEFVRYCYRRHRATWPQLYDDMCAVAARGAFKGLGFAELAERGISFALLTLPGLAALAQEVAQEECRPLERDQSSALRVVPT